MSTTAQEAMQEDVMQLSSKQGLRGTGTPLGGANALASLPLIPQSSKAFQTSGWLTLW